MDGYALRASDTSAGPTRLRVMGTIFAGDATERPLGAGEAMRIMTGAPLPDGADSVSMIEEVDVENDGQIAFIRRTISQSEFVRHPGEDVAVGQVLLGAGTEFGPVHVGVLAGQGVSTVTVHPRPRVGVFSTGDELAGPGTELAPGQIRDANRPMLHRTAAPIGLRRPRPRHRGRRSSGHVERAARGARQRGVTPSSRRAA
jgi:molybdopterin molybdotransferase